jgi:hypothetical protein
VLTTALIYAVFNGVNRDGINLLYGLDSLLIGGLLTYLNDKK